MSPRIIPTKTVRSLLIPDHGGQTEHFLRNCPHPVIGIAVRGSPIPWQSAALGITEIRGAHHLIGRRHKLLTVEFLMISIVQPNSATRSWFDSVVE